MARQLFQCGPRLQVLALLANALRVRELHASRPVWFLYIGTPYLYMNATIQ